ncbi:MAG: 23S rRNA (adenine(2503)-C(2))-methyltransferase RlmN [Elusimicrobia bacterium]|nr:23S rRNA (adenine(2503)-C(2))-methyltransferase RlmN [Elusimicrobiota bacterium]
MTKETGAKKFFLDIEPDGIEKLIVAAGHDAYRAAQIVTWVYQKQCDDFSTCTNIPADLRTYLSQHYYLRSMTIAGKKMSAIDGTVRYEFKTRDNLSVFAVFLPTRDRRTVCISSQVGCPIQCRFCASGAVKMKRNLTRGEIVEQVLALSKDTGQRITGVLFMGMGEPLLNYNAVVSSVRSLTDFHQFGIGRRHITLSTVGIVPLIRRLAEEQLGVRLALSLHAPDDDVRRTLISERVVPFRIVDILEAGLFYSRKNKTRLTLEYIVFDGVNDDMKTMKSFVDLIARHVHPTDLLQVNLIAYNDTVHDSMHMEGSKTRLRLAPPRRETMEHIKNFLIKRDILAIIREPKGADIEAACGQLGF